MNISGFSSEGLTTFSHFPELPAERRLKTWNFCLTPPRISYIETKSGHSKEGLPGFRDLLISSARFLRDDCARKTDCIPRLLHVNGEAREVRMASFDLAFGSYHWAGTAYVKFEKYKIKFRRLVRTRSPFFSGVSFGVQMVQK